MTYYYAYVDENNQVTWLGAMPSPLTAPGYLEITQDQYENGNLMGKYWNGSEFVDTLYKYYAVLDAEGIVIDIIQYEGTLEGDTVVEIDSLDTTLLGLWYDRDGDQTFKSIPIHILSNYTTDQISYKNEDKWLSTKLDEIEAAIQNAGGNTTALVASEVLAALITVDGANSGLDADMLDGKHASAFADVDHTHTQYAPSSHTHEGYAEADHTHTGYAESGHTHSEYAETGHTHSGYAASNHFHSEYASAGHSHSGYASSSHSHSNYLPIAGGTVTGDLEIDGELDVWGETNFRSAVRTLGTQTLYNSGSQIMFGSNNLASRICGSAISATKTISVDSDERLKENIQDVDTQKVIDFINGIDVKTFNYKGDDKGCIGAIAQQVVRNVPEVAKYFVSKNSEGYFSVKIADLVFPLIVAVQELNKQVEELKRG